MSDSSEFGFKFVNLADTKPLTATGQIAGLLESAARILRNHDTDRLDSVAWRVADASLLLRELIATPGSGWSNVKDVGGIHRPTGLGAMLGDAVDDGGVLARTRGKSGV